MPKIIKIILIILAELIFITSLWVILPTLLIIDRNGVRHLGEIDTLPLDINHSYLQSFITDQDNLSSIALQLKNPEIKSTDTVYLQVANEKHETIRDLSVSGRNIADPSWINFDFIPIESTKGDLFYLKINADAPKDNLLYIFGNHQNKELNFKSSYKALSTKEALVNNLNNQKHRISQMSKIHLFSYIGIVTITSLALFLAL